MADLQAIYRDFGIQGVVPYSFQRGGEAYQFLVEKMRREVPLYLIVSDVTRVPYLDVMHLGTYAMVCLSEEQAGFLCDKLARRGESTYPVKLMDIDEKRKMIQYIRDLGTAGIQIDDGVFVYIQDLTEEADYDGFKSLDLPLRNAAINSALYLLSQKIAVGNAYRHLLLHFFRQVQIGHLLVPVTIADEARGILTKDDFIVPIMKSEEGKNLIQVFTDSLTFQNTCENNERFQKMFPQRLAYVSEYRFLSGLLAEESETAIIINPDTANLSMDRSSFLSLEAASIAVEGGKQRSGVENEDDSIPDFLK